MVRNCNPMLFYGNKLTLGQEYPTRGDPQQQLTDPHMSQMLFPDTQELMLHISCCSELEHGPLKADKWFLSWAKRDHCHVMCLLCSIKLSTLLMLPAVP